MLTCISPAYVGILQFAESAYNGNFTPISMGYNGKLKHENSTKADLYVGISRLKIINPQGYWRPYPLYKTLV